MWHLGRCLSGSQRAGRAAACEGEMLQWWHVPCPTDTGVPPWFLSVFEGWVQTGGILRGGHLPGVEAMEEHPDAASSLVGKIQFTRGFLVTVVYFTRAVTLISANYY